MGGQEKDIRKNLIILATVIANIGVKILRTTTCLRLVLLRLKIRQF